jgi:peptidoglycan hydrolase-like protein with peptidoglycan-binding domain
VSRRVVLTLALAAVIAAAGIGWAAGTHIKSPAQVASEAEPPEPSLITVPVVKMVIANDVVTRGTVRFDEPETVQASAPADPELSPVVTWVPSVGDELDEGSVLYELAGRPTFALQGDLPLFRTVKPGDEGEDIEQLQTTLTRLGFDPGIVDGVYGPDTEAAVEAFYRSQGYDPIPPDQALLDQVDALQDVVDSARDGYNAVVEQKQTAQQAQKAVTDAAAALQQARDELDTAEARLARAEDGTHPDTEQPPTEQELAELEAAVTAAEETVQTRQDAYQAALADADIAGPVPDTKPAKDALDEAIADLAEARADVGSPVPASEFLFFKVFPIRIDGVSAVRGDVAAGELMRVSGSRLAIDSSVSVDEADLIEEGDAVTIELSRLNVELGGTIVAKAEVPGTNGVGADEVYIEIVPDEVRAELNNTNVKITIPVATRSSGGDVLAVPAAALSATGSGDTIVTVEDDDGATRVVTVTAGLSAPGGMVEVTPLDGELTEGDRVVVGFQQGSTPTTDAPVEG